MKKLLVIVAIVVGVVAIGMSYYNGFVSLGENVEQAWGNVQTTYERRSDLIGNLVKTVQGAGDFEKSTLTAVIEARAKATSTTIDASKMTPEALEAFNNAQSGLSSALSKLLVSIERYPDLKTNQNFLKLQDELTSTENQILTARTRYNEAIKPYNLKVKKMPGAIVARLFGFDAKPYFKASDKAQKAPDVKFDFK